ncbi:MAG: PA2778 family cysteine peptidase [Oligoflexales bacterium]
MRFLYSFLAGISTLATISCTTLSPQTSSLLDESIVPKSKEVLGVQNLSKDDGDCGPAALAMVLNWSGRNIPISELKPKMYTPLRNGSLPSDMISTARNYGMVAVEVSSMTGIVKELGGGYPVIALLNMGFSWFPIWHYVAIVGYDLDDQNFKLFTGKEAMESMPLSHFERHWSFSKFWALVVLPPDRLAYSAGELAHMQAASGLESLGHLSAAKKAYQTILKKWPNSFTAHFGMGNIAYQEEEYTLAEGFLKKAVALNPASKAAKNNLSIVKEELQSAK